MRLPLGPAEAQKSLKLRLELALGISPCRNLVLFVPQAAIQFLHRIGRILIRLATSIGPRALPNDPRCDIAV